MIEYYIEIWNDYNYFCTKDKYYSIFHKEFRHNFISAVKKVPLFTIED